MRRFLYLSIFPAVFLEFFLQAAAPSQLLSGRHSGQAPSQAEISIVRVEDDLMVKWLCPDFHSTLLLAFDSDAGWVAVDGASTAVPETQYYCLRRNLYSGFFRTRSEELQEFPRLRLMAPTRSIHGLPTPVRIEVMRDDGSVDWEVWEGQVSLSSGHDDILPAPLPLHSGVASVLLPAGAVDVGVIEAWYDGQVAQRNVQYLGAGYDTVEVAGELSEPVTVWKPGDGVIHVVDFLTLPSENILRIYPDTIVLLDPQKSITVHGTVESLGTVEHPVLFAASEPDQPWGQISHSNTSTKSSYRATFFTGGGDSPPAGHTGRGPVIRFDHAEIEFDHCTFMDNYGKGLYGEHGDLTFTHCLFSRSVMGMEVVDTDIVLDRCLFIEMPPGGDALDHDALYLNGGGNMSVTNSIFAIGGDDGIDTLRSFPTIENCIIRGYEDKGVSVYHGTTRIKNCLISSNQYGISAKGDETNVYVDRTTIARNQCSLQSKDKYGVPEAVIKYYVTNSILWEHDQAVRTDYPLEDITISYCDLQGDELFPGEGNMNDDPLFFDPGANDFRLRENSPCLGKGQNDTDMGCDYTKLP